MYPDNQQYGPPAQPPKDPYDFIMQNPQKPSRPSLAPGSMKARIIVIVVGVIILIILGVIASTLLTAGDKAQTQKYLEVAQKQTEIIRLSTIVDKKGRSLQTRSFAITTRLDLESSQKTTTTILSKRGIKEKSLSKVIGLGKNSKSDTELDAAEKTGRFDETYTKIIEAEIASYQKLLNSAASGASKKDKEALQKAYTGAATLVLKPEKKKTAPGSTTPSEELLDEEATIFGEESGTEEL